MRRQIPFALVFIFGTFMVFQYFVPHETSEWIYEYLLDWITVIGIFALALGIWSFYKVSVDKIKNKNENWPYSIISLLGLFVMIFFGFTARTGDSWGFYYPALILLIGGMAMLIKAQTEASSSSSKSKKSAMIGLGLIVVFVIISIMDDSWNFYFYTQEGLKNVAFTDFFEHIMIPIQSTMFSLLAFFIASAAYRAFRARNILATLLLVAALIVMLRFNPYLGPVSGLMESAADWLLNVPNLAAKRAIIIGIGLGIVATSLKVLLGIERSYMGKG